MNEDFEVLESVTPPSTKGRLTNQQILLGKKLDPLEIIKIYPEDEWEQFVREWVEGIRGKYTDVRRAGGSRDKGRDVIGYVHAMNAGGPWDNYQCKHYAHALHPSDLRKELAKLCFYTFEKKYSPPRAYYFVAPRGVGPEVVLLLENPASLKAGLIVRWGKGDLLRIGKLDVVLEGELRKHVENFDFSIVKDLPPAKIIEGHRETRHFAARFGGGLVRLPPDKADVPDQIDSKVESRYVEQLLQAYGDYLCKELSTAADLNDHPPLKKHFDRQRTHFYLAELLRNFTRDNIPEDGCFERLQEAIYDGVIDTAEGRHQNGFDRVKKTIEVARAIQIDSHPLKECLEGYHRGGVCHQLANSDRLTWVQDSALSVAGLDQESTSDRPFTMVDGKPVLSGRGLKGAAVAMARRFFDPLPRSVSEDPGRGAAFQRSAWEFSSAVPDWKKGDCPNLRAGVGILQKTGARASGVLYDREVVPAGTRWPLVFRVDWSWAREEAGEAEGILGYVLATHWANGRCWLGGDVARGLGWCHIENLRAYRIDDQAYETWVTSGRSTLPQALREIPLVEPTRSWRFRTLEVQISFGEYRPNGAEESPWGLDMLSVGPHSADLRGQTLGSGIWARPSWAEDAPPPNVELPTDRAILMEQNCPLLPGASVRGPLRHTFSRAARAQGKSITDPHDVQGDLGENDPAGEIFGTVKRSSRVLICDARAVDDWVAARLHMHAEDEFSAGSYGSAKRDAVRVLKGTFPVRIVVEGADEVVVGPLINDIDRLIALGALCHIPVGGHKTRGAGWGRWTAGKWKTDDVAKARNWSPPAQVDTGKTTTGSFVFASQMKPAEAEVEESSQETTLIHVEHGTLSIADLALGRAASEARRMIADGTGELVAWWCEPTIDFSVTTPPAIFGWKWPDDGTLRVDEATFFFERGSWRVARTASGVRWVLIQEVGSQAAGAESVVVSQTPARLHGDTTRFSAKSPGKDRLIVREWRSGMTSVGFTLNTKER